MIPWEHLDTAKIPDSEGELRLMRRGTEYSIMTGGTELMNSRLSGSEKALATLPELAQTRLNRKRKATDADASIDPMNDPQVKAAVNQANFELLLGFQLNEAQLAYNATK